MHTYRETEVFWERYSSKVVLVVKSLAGATLTKVFLFIYYLHKDINTYIK